MKKRTFRNRKGMSMILQIREGKADEVLKKYIKKKSKANFPEGIVYSGQDSLHRNQGTAFQP